MTKMGKDSTLPSLSAVKGIQMLLAFQVYMIVNESRVSKKGKQHEIHAKALQLYAQQVDKFITDNYSTFYPKSIFSLRPDDHDKVTKNLLLSTTFTCSKLLDGKTICFKGSECFKTIMNNILPVYNKHLTASGDIPPEKSIEDVLRETLCSLNERTLRARGTAITVTDEVATDTTNPTEEGASNEQPVVAALSAEDMHIPFSWPSFLLYGPPCVHLFNRPVAPLLQPHIITDIPAEVQVHSTVDGEASTSSSATPMNSNIVLEDKEAPKKAAKSKIALQETDDLSERSIVAREEANALQKQKMKLEAFSTMMALLGDDSVKRASVKRKYMDFLEHIISTAAEDT